MLGGIRMAALFVVLAVGTLGCAGERQVRYVYQDQVSGVIGMPENSSHWPTYYRKHAEELMAQHFPEGYEIVRAEEVVEGSRTLTINGANAAEIGAGATNTPITLGKLGRTSTRTQSDNVKIKECRIVYRKVDPARQRGDYAEQASWSPAPYIDPNAPERRWLTAKPVAPGVPPPPAPEPAHAGAKPEAEMKEKPEAPPRPGELPAVFSFEAALGLPAPAPAAQKGEAH
jgi:hypothetical protein